MLLLRFNLRTLLHYIVSRGNSALVLDCLPVVKDVNFSRRPWKKTIAEFDLHTLTFSTIERYDKSSMLVCGSEFSIRFWTELGLSGLSGGPNKIPMWYKSRGQPIKSVNFSKNPSNHEILSRSQWGCLTTQ